VTAFEFLEKALWIFDGADSEDFVILACIVLIQCQAVTDRHLCNS